MLYKLLCPHRRADSIYEITPQQLLQQGILGIICDLDNTIIPWDSPALSAEAAAWLEGLLTHNIKVCLLSNNLGPRVNQIAATLALPFVARACKPSKTGFSRALKILNLPPRQVAVVGDQLFTDILGGNRLGLCTIWVKPLSTEEFAGTKITRRIEKITVRLLERRGILK